MSHSFFWHLKTYKCLEFIAYSNQTATPINRRLKISMSQRLTMGLHRRILLLIALTFLASSCILKRMGSQSVLDAALGPFQDTAIVPLIRG